MRPLSPILFVVGISTSALAATPTPYYPAADVAAANQTITVTSEAFGNNEPIPREYTCDGSDVSPPLTWSNAPRGTKSVAILVDDPDAPGGTFLHWLVTGLDPSTTSLRKGGELPGGAVAMKNMKGTAGYMGPCPPTGRHRYRFNVYALDRSTGTPQTRAAFEAAIQGHVLAHGLLVGTYQKSQ